MNTLDEIELFQDQTIAGIPTPLFLSNIVIGLFLCGFFKLAGFFFALMILLLLWYVHRNDPQVLFILIKSTKSINSVSQDDVQVLSVRRIP